MSQITTTNIDVFYPVAGKDNDSQGFRDNFNNIVGALSIAKTEIEELQNKTLKVQTLGSNPTTITNDLAGSSINNGFYNNFHGVSYITQASGTADIDIKFGGVQQFVLSSDTSFRFSNWPINTKYAVVRVHFLSNTSGSWSPTLTTENAGIVHLESSFPSPFTLSTNGKHKVIEAWSYNKGATVYVRYLGEF